MTTPRATYRLQLHAGFGFAKAAEAVPYFAELGVSHLYLSPILQAAEGSTHGYDVVDPDHVSRELGGEDGFADFVKVAKEAGLGILLDIVPNHMSIAGTGNRWWLDVLENGPASYYAHYFDVDWSATSDDRVLLPVLGERYGRALTSGTLAVEAAEGTLEIRAHDMRFPIAPRSLGAILRRAGDRIANTRLQFIGDALAGMPSPRDRELEARRRRHRDKSVLLGMLGDLIRGDRSAAQALTDEVRAINTDPVELDGVLEAQNYRLVHWTTAASQLSYRRFFDITTLVGIRNEDRDVLLASHRRVFGWLADGTIEGVRVDHVDGLRDPAGYLRELRAHAPDAWIVVEKILGGEERLPASWPIDGTTGYDFMEKIGQLFVDPDSEAQITRTFETYTRETWDPIAGSRKARGEVMSDALHSELSRLTELAVRACAVSPACRDYTRAEIEMTLIELFAGYSAYRTYLGEDQRSADDRARIAAAATAALEARPELDRDLLSFLEAALAFELPSPEALELARVAQQVTGPVVAKGDEDTLLYRHVRLLSRCDVGADLKHYGADVDALHRELAEGKPRALLATSTHDTKRSEDVRARIAVLSEFPAVWDETVGRWRARADEAWGDVPADRTFEFTMWQTLVGAWPLSLERAQQFAEKATREARLRTSWRKPDAAYEAARTRWLEAIYGDKALMAEVAELAARIAPHGDRNSLAMLLVKLTAPGVPDFYQGTELRDDSLVDPDNRRAVDLGERQRLLRTVNDAAAAQVASDLRTAKLLVIRRVLALRRRSAALFERTYQPLAASGPHAHRVFAFSRGGDLVTVVPRLGVRADGWESTTIALAQGTWRELFSDRTVTGGTVALAELWRDLPVALLVRGPT